MHDMAATNKAPNAPLKQQCQRPIDGTTQTWVFDLDNTLYSAHCNLFDQVDQLISDFVEKLTGLPRPEARALQKRYLMDHGTTLNGLMHNYDLDPHDYLKAVHAIDFSPIEEDKRLQTALQRLEGRKLVFTNAEETYALRVLERLGIAHFMDDIFDIVKADLKPKPEQDAYQKFIDNYAVNPEQAVMVEDMARNLKLAHDMGMATIWVNTGTNWGMAGHCPSHISQETDNLSHWLHELTK